MGQDKTNSDGLLKDSYSNTTSEQGGWQARLKKSAKGSKKHYRKGFTKLAAGGKK